jgi:hypothetical protein
MSFRLSGQHAINTALQDHSAQTPVGQRPTQNLLPASGELSLTRRSAPNALERNSLNNTFSPLFTPQELNSADRKKFYKQIPATMAKVSFAVAKKNPFAVLNLKPLRKAITAASIKIEQAQGNLLPINAALSIQKDSIGALNTILNRIPSDQISTDTRDNPIVSIGVRQLDTEDYRYSSQSR